MKEITALLTKAHVKYQRSFSLSANVFSAIKSSRVSQREKKVAIKILEELKRMREQSEMWRVSA